MSRTMLTTMLGIALAAGFSFPAGSAGWKKSADLALTFNQSSYSESWTGGEFGSLTWALSANMQAEKELSSKVKVRETLKLSFGQTHVQAEDSQKKKRWQAPEKSSDRIFSESLARFTLKKSVDPFLALTFESQFFDARDPEVNRYINPILLTEAAGIGRTFIKNDKAELYSRLGFALRQHISNDVIPGTTPKETEFNTATDGGLEWVADVSQLLGDGYASYVSKLRVFQAFFNSESDELKGKPNEDYWKAPDVAWENTLSASISKYIQVSLFLELLYDKEIDRRGRFREVLGLGVAYKLF